MRKIQSQGVHITIVGAGRRTSIDFWERLGMPSSSTAEPRQRGGEPPLLRPRRRPARHVITNEERTPDASRVRGTRERPPPRVRALAGDVPPHREALDGGDPPSGVKDRGFMDRSTSTTRSASSSSSRRTGSSRRSATRTRTCFSRRTNCASSAATTSTRATSRTRSSCSSPARGRRCPRIARPEPLLVEEERMASNTLSILKPSVNNLTTRIFVRAAEARLRRGRRVGEEVRARVPREDPADLTPLLGEAGLPGSAVGELLRDHAVPLQQARPRPVLPDRSRQSGRWWTARCSTWSGRCTRSSPGRPIRPRLSPVRRRGRLLGGRRGHEGEGGAGRGRGAGGAAREEYRAFFLDGRTFIGGDHPSIADIRFAATLEFPRAIDYELPRWAEGLHGRHRVRARRGVLRAGRGRPRLYRLREVAGRVT